MLTRCDVNLSFMGLVFPDNHLKYCGFTSSILTHEGNLRAFTYRETCIFEEPLRCYITEGEFIESDDNISFCHRE